jgi:hypothetical protein
MTWRVEPTNTTTRRITLYGTGAGYNFTVDWGDGVQQTSQTSNALTYTYATGGTYQVRILGAFPRFFCNNQADCPKLISIDQW